ncbi:hypothetical protein GEV41_11145 [Pseudomonas putida]|nr:hypothetical protein GEV41_11145 [Pseudomonas putida]
MCRHPSILGRTAGFGRPEQCRLDHCWFFLGAGVSDVDGLIATAYDLAWFWKSDPEQVMERPLDVILEAAEHSQRIAETLRGEDG